jgi:hypothetical protein
VYREGNQVIAEFSKYTPQFAEWISQGRIPGMSTMFYSEDDPNNPNPGEPTFRHFAGVLFPSVKGLEMPGFAEETAPTKDDLIASGAEELPEGELAAFSESVSSTIIEAMFRLRDWLLEQNGRDTAEALLPLPELQYALSQIDQSRRNEADERDRLWETLYSFSERLEKLAQQIPTSSGDDNDDLVAFAEPVPNPTPTMTNEPLETAVQPEAVETDRAPALEAAFSEAATRAANLEAENQALRDRLAELELQQVRGEVMTFCEPLPENLKQPIAVGEQSVTLAAFAEKLPATDRQFLREWIGQIREAITDQATPEPEPETAIPGAMFAEVSGDATAPLYIKSVSAPAFSEYDPESSAYAAKVSAYAMQHNISYDAAARALTSL